MADLDLNKIQTPEKGSLNLLAAAVTQFNTDTAELDATQFQDGRA